MRDERKGPGDRLPRALVLGCAGERLTAEERRFFAAAVEGDLGSLETLLAHDVVLHGDGGGKAPAIARPVLGRSLVARALVVGVKQLLEVPGTALRPVEVNGQPGTVVLDGAGRVVGVMALDIAGQQVRSVIGIVNPDKVTMPQFFYWHGDPVVSVLAFVAILLASINVFGGFAVTRRMLGMFTR